MGDGMHVVVGQLPAGVALPEATLQHFAYSDVANADIFIAVTEGRTQARCLKYRWGADSDVSVDLTTSGSRV